MDAGCLLHEDDVEHFNTIERASAAQDCLFSLVVLAGVEAERQVVIDPPGEGARRLANILLGVVAYTH